MCGAQNYHSRDLPCTVLYAHKKMNLAPQTGSLSPAPGWWTAGKPSQVWRSDIHWITGLFPPRLTLLPFVSKVFRCPAHPIILLEFYSEVFFQVVVDTAGVQPVQREQTVAGVHVLQAEAVGQELLPPGTQMCREDCRLQFIAPWSEFKQVTI